MRGIARELLTLVVLVTTSAGADPIEPPPELEGGDYVTEVRDSLEGGSVEWRYGVAGDARRSHVRRALEFRGDSVWGAVRDGADDPLAGGDVAARDNGRDLRVGRLAPRWSLGLVLGAPAEPWSHAATLLDPERRPRGAVGEGFWCALEPVGIEVLGGRFSRRDLAGLAWDGSAVRTGVVATRGGDAQWSLGLHGAEAAAEVAMDRDGVWIAEAQVLRSVRGAHLALRARGGHEAFRSLAEPKRTGPARAVGVLLASERPRQSIVAGLTAWRFAADATGARASIALEHRAEGSVWRTGWEEQHGPRRISSATAGRSMRQGAWIECRAGRPPLVLVVREEVWGTAAFARRAVRRAFEAGAEIEIVGGVTVRAAHAVLEARPGETIYLSEVESDRLVLRAVSGAVRRTRVLVRIPLARGAVHGGLGLGLGRSGARRADWSLQWSRRLKLRARR